MAAFPPEWPFLLLSTKRAALLLVKERQMAPGRDKYAITCADELAAQFVLFFFLFFFIKRLTQGLSLTKTFLTRARSV